MTLFFTYQLLLICLIAAWNAFVIIWKLENKYSKTWHLFGLIWRIGVGISIAWLMVFPIEFIFTWQMFAFWALAFINVSWTFYDFLINLFWCKYGNLHTIWYVDDKGINAKFLKLLSKKGTWIFRVILIVINILIIAI